MNISYDERSVHVLDALQKLEDSIGVEVVERVINVLAEGEAWLART